MTKSVPFGVTFVRAMWGPERNRGYSGDVIKSIACNWATL
jgi:hypothetical protein